MTERFPKNEVEFDGRFSSEQACFDCLFQLRWAEGFSAFVVTMLNMLWHREDFTFVASVNIGSH